MCEEDKDWPGKRAKDLGFMVGKVGCPHCGIVTEGALTPICACCDQPYWTDEDMKLFGYVKIKENNKEENKIEEK